MCRKHRRCRTNKTAAAARARNYRARRREAATAAAAAAEPTAPASNDQEPAAVNPEQPAGGDVTPNPPNEPGKRKNDLPRKSAFARRIETFAKQERATQTRKQETSAHLAEHEKAAAVARKRNQARDQQAWEQRQARQARQAQGDVTRPKRRHEVEDHTGDHTDDRASKQDRVWTASPSPVPTTPRPKARGRDATEDTRRNSGRDGGVGPVSGEGNLTLVSPDGPLHISTFGRGGKPEVVGDVTPASGSEPTTSARPRQSSARTRQARREPGQANVTDRPDTSPDTRPGVSRGTGQARQDTGHDHTRRNRMAHDSDTGRPVNVVGDRHVTVTGARPGQVTRVTNHAAPGAHVGHQSTGHVHGITVTGVTHHGSTEDITDRADGQRAWDIARNAADHVHRAMADMADALRDVTHNPDHDNSTGGTQGIQAPHIHNSRVHNSRVIRDHD